MGCGLCAPKVQNKPSSVSPSAQSVGKAFATDAEASRPRSWRAREASSEPEGAEGGPVGAAAAEAEAAEAREGPRAAASALSQDQAELPGMPESKAEAEKGKAQEPDVLETVLEEEPKQGKMEKTEKEPTEQTAEGADSSDESVDEEEMEASLRAVAEVLTPRRGNEAGMETKAPMPQPPPVRQAPISARSSRPLYEITSPMSKPQAELPPFPPVTVSTSTQLLLLTWARWGRNMCRIKQEEQIKSLQHKRFPRSPPPIQLSPQPTPRESSGSGAAPRTGAAAWRAGGELGMGTTVHSREGGSPGKAFDLAELREEQRDSMAEQGARMKLTRGLGSSAAQAHSLGTPGFGVDTPGFPGGSGVASADASVASSGVASPVKGGQMSPWILEAEALCEETEEEGSPGGGGWGLEPELDTLLLLEKEIRSGQREPILPEDITHIKEDQPVLDEDELQRVEMFEESPKKSEAGSDRPDRLQEVKSEQPEEPVADPETNASTFEYVVGEKVSYYSASHRAWMPARIVERKSRTIYVIDKQMRGCMAKVRASELVSEAEERNSPVLRAFTMLEKAERRRKRPSSAASTTTSSKPHSPVTVPGNRGRIVRDDFSDDSD